MVIKKVCLKTKLCQKRSRQTEEQIVSAAAQLFATKGYSRVTMQDIADAAGIGKATLYYHTPGKEELCLLVLGARMEGFMSEARSIAGGDGTPSTKLREVLGVLTTYLSSGQQLMDFMVPQIGKMSPKYIGHLDKFRKRYLAILESLVQEGIDAGEFRADVDPAISVRAILGMVIYFHVLPKVFGEPYRMGAVGDDLADLALGGLLAKGAAT